jgi:hypothetical protein
MIAPTFLVTVTEDDLDAREQTSVIWISGHMRDGTQVRFWADETLINHIGDQFMRTMSRTIKVDVPLGSIEGAI